MSDEFHYRHHENKREDGLGLLDGLLGEGHHGLGSLQRLVGANGTEFWVGAAVGAAAVALLSNPKVRETVGSLFKMGASAETEAEQPAAADEAPEKTAKSRAKPTAQAKPASAKRKSAPKTRHA